MILKNRIDESESSTIGGNWVCRVNWGLQVLEKGN